MTRQSGYGTQRRVKRGRSTRPRGLCLVAFSDDRGSLETNVGQLSLGTTLRARQTSINDTQSTLLLESSWIKYHSADILGLPHEYRGVCHDARGSLPVIGQASGLFCSSRSDDTAGCVCRDLRDLGARNFTAATQTRPSLSTSTYVIAYSMVQRSSRTVAV